MEQPETTEAEKRASGSLERMVRHPHLQPWMMLPPKSDVCQECAVKHDPDMPHNQQSMFWQYNFFGKHGRWPTWADALAHCAPEMQQQWIYELAKYGVTVKMPNASVLPSPARKRR